jgi:hypothetical protein
VALLADSDGKPFALLLPLTPGELQSNFRATVSHILCVKELFRDFVKLQRRYADARAEQAVVDLGDADDNYLQPGERQVVLEQHI